MAIANYEAAQSSNYKPNPAPVPVMPTVASALGSIDELNNRLSNISGLLANIASSVGGPFPAKGISAETDSGPGMVNRLNNSADSAHRHATEIEELIGSISRALG